MLLLQSFDLAHTDPQRLSRFFLDHPFLFQTPHHFYIRLVLFCSFAVAPCFVSLSQRGLFNFPYSLKGSLLLYANTTPYFIPTGITLDSASPLP